jgi:hypothetical protein
MFITFCGYAFVSIIASVFLVVTIIEVNHHQHDKRRRRHAAQLQLQMDEANERDADLALLEVKLFLKGLERIHKN